MCAPLGALGGRPTPTLAFAGAWCLFEVTTALGAGHRLHVALSPDDRASLRSLLEDHFDDIAHIFARLDAADAQITKLEDRDYILPRVLALPGAERGARHLSVLSDS